MYSLYYPFKTCILSCMHDTSVYLSWYSAQHSWAITHNTVGRPTPLGNNAQPSTFVLPEKAFTTRAIDRCCAVEAHTFKAYSFIMRVAI